MFIMMAQKTSVAIPETAKGSITAILDEKESLQDIEL